VRDTRPLFFGGGRGRGSLVLNAILLEGGGLGEGELLLSEIKSPTSATRLQL